MNRSYKFLLMFALILGMAVILISATKTEPENINNEEPQAKSNDIHDNLIVFQEGDMFIYRTKSLSTAKSSKFRELAGSRLKAELTIPSSVRGSILKYGQKDPTASYEEDPSTGLISFNKGMRSYLDQGGKSLPSSKEANQIAEKFLNESGLMPENKSELKMMHSGGLRMAEPNGKPVDVMRTVSFGRMLNGVPVYGPGSKILVNVGNNGEIIGATSKWKELETSKSTQVSRKSLKTSREAQAELEKQLVQDYGRGASFEFINVSLAYFDQGDGAIQPAYFFQTDIRLKGGKEQETNFQYIGVIPANKTVVEQIRDQLTPPEGLKTVEKLATTAPKQIKRVTPKDLD